MTENTRGEQLLRERIRAERSRYSDCDEDNLWMTLRSGDGAGARRLLLFFTEPAKLDERTNNLLDRIERGFRRMSDDEKACCLEFLAFLAIDLNSALPEWHLRPALGTADLEALGRRVSARLDRIAADARSAEAAVLDELRRATTGRLKAESVTEPEEVRLLTEAATGEGLSDFSANVIRDIKASNFTASVREHRSGKLATEIGNDYADFLRYAMWLGASFATTNPVLIKLAWDIEPDYWNTVVDGIIETTVPGPTLGNFRDDASPGLNETVEALTKKVTIGVVERNCRLLRPIFLLTEGKLGYVSLQVNPEAHDDSSKMFRDAKEIYQELERRIDGVPNVVIKVPATAAGLAAAEQLTAAGIGVTVTLTFSLFQALPFARVLTKGHALVSYIAIMNGRLAFPVRDELARANVEGGAGAARWAGVAVARKVARKLYGAVAEGGLGIDPTRVKIMIASLRIYEDWIPDISELWGVPLLTVFPNVRRAYDAHARQSLPTAIDAETPKTDLKVLTQSELFRQAWWADDEDEISVKPDRVLTLEAKDAKAVAAWTPVRETLTQFIESYRKMCSMVRSRLLAASAELRTRSGGTVRP